VLEVGLLVPAAPALAESITITHDVTELAVELSAAWPTGSLSWSVETGAGDVVPARPVGWPGRVAWRFGTAHIEQATSVRLARFDGSMTSPLPASTLPVRTLSASPVSSSTPGVDITPGARVPVGVALAPSDAVERVALGGAGAPPSLGVLRAGASAASWYEVGSVPSEDLEWSLSGDVANPHAYAHTVSVAASNALASTSAVLLVDQPAVNAQYAEGDTLPVALDAPQAAEGLSLKYVDVMLLDADGAVVARSPVSGPSVSLVWNLPNVTQVESYEIRARAYYGDSYAYVDAPAVPISVLPQLSIPTPQVSGALYDALVGTVNDLEITNGAGLSASLRLLDAQGAELQRSGRRAHWVLPATASILTVEATLSDRAGQSETTTWQMRLHDDLSFGSAVPGAAEFDHIAHGVGRVWATRGDKLGTLDAQGAWSEVASFGVDAAALAVEGSHAYVAHRDGTVSIVDIGADQVLGAIPAGAAAPADKRVVLATSTDHLVWASGTTLMVYERSGTRLAHVSTLNTSSSVGEVSDVAQHDLGFAVAGTSGLGFLDEDNSDVAKRDDAAYRALIRRGDKVYALGDHAIATFGGRWVTTTPMPGLMAHSGAVHNGRLLVSDGSSSIHVVDAHDARRLAPAGKVYLGAGAPHLERVAVVADRVVLGHGVGIPLARSATSTARLHTPGQVFGEVVSAAASDDAVFAAHGAYGAVTTLKSGGSFTSSVDPAAFTRDVRDVRVWGGLRFSLSTASEKLAALTSDRECAVLSDRLIQGFDVGHGAIAVVSGNTLLVATLTLSSSNAGVQCPSVGDFEEVLAPDGTDFGGVVLGHRQLIAATKSGNLYRVGFGELPLPEGGTPGVALLASGLGAVDRIVGDEDIVYVSSGDTLTRVDLRSQSLESLAFPTSIRDLAYQGDAIHVAASDKVYGIGHSEPLSGLPLAAKVVLDAPRVVTAIARHIDWLYVGMGSRDWGIWRAPMGSTKLGVSGVLDGEELSADKPLELLVSAGADIQAVRYMIREDGQPSNTATALGVTNRAPFGASLPWPASIDRGRAYVVYGEAQRVDGTTVTSPEVPVFVRGDRVDDEKGESGAISVSLSVAGKYWPAPAELTAVVSSSLREEIDVEFYRCPDDTAWRQRSLAMCTLLGTSTAERGYRLSISESDGLKVYGARAVSARGKDTYSNVATLLRDRDDAAPTLSLVVTSSASGGVPSQGTPYTVRVTANDELLDVVALKRDGQFVHIKHVGGARHEHEYVDPAIGSGAVTWEAYATDVSGRVTTTSTIVDVVVDMPPVVTIDSVQGISPSTPISDGGAFTVRATITDEAPNIRAWAEITTPSAPPCDLGSTAGVFGRSDERDSGASKAWSESHTGQLSDQSLSAEVDVRVRACAVDLTGNLNYAEQSTVLTPNFAPDADAVGTLEYAGIMATGASFKLRFFNSGRIRSGFDEDSPTVTAEVVYEAQSPVTTKITAQGGATLPWGDETQALWLDVPASATPGVHEFRLRLRDNTGRTSDLCLADNARRVSSQFTYWEVRQDGVSCDAPGAKPFKVEVRPAPFTVVLAAADQASSPKVNPTSLSSGEDFILRAQVRDGAGAALQDVSFSVAESGNAAFQYLYGAGDWASSISSSFAGAGTYDLSFVPSRDAALVSNMPIAPAGLQVVVSGSAPERLVVEHSAVRGGGVAAGEYPSAGDTFRFYVHALDVYKNITSSADGQIVTIDLPPTDFTLGGVSAGAFDAGLGRAQIQLTNGTGWVEVVAPSVAGHYSATIGRPSGWSETQYVDMQENTYRRTSSSSSDSSAFDVQVLPGEPSQLSVTLERLPSGSLFFLGDTVRASIELQDRHGNVADEGLDEANMGKIIPRDFDAKVTISSPSGTADIGGLGELRVPLNAGAGSVDFSHASAETVTLTVEDVQRTGVASVPLPAPGIAQTATATFSGAGSFVAHAHFGLAANDLRSPLVFEFDAAIDEAAGVVGAVSVSDAGVLVPGVTTVTSARTVTWVPDGDLTMGRTFDVDLPAGLVQRASDSAPSRAQQIQVVGPELGMVFAGGDHIVFEGDTFRVNFDFMWTDSHATLEWGTNGSHLRLFTRDVLSGARTQFYDQGFSGSYYNTSDRSMAFAEVDTTLTGVLAFPQLAPGSSIEVVADPIFYQYLSPKIDRLPRVANTLELTWLTSTGDHDGDGISNADERDVFGTDPLVADLEPMISPPKLGLATDDMRSPFSFQVSRSVQLDANVSASSVFTVTQDSNSSQIPGVAAISADGLTVTWVPDADLELGETFSIQLADSALHVSGVSSPSATDYIQAPPQAWEVTGPEIGFVQTGAQPLYHLEGTDFSAVVKYRHTENSNVTMGYLSQTNTDITFVSEDLGGTSSWTWDTILYNDWTWFAAGQPNEWAWESNSFDAPFDEDGQIAWIH
ncbi:MAG: hypothetical protein AAGI01_02090, partial [Myxococcota bacterium]